MLLFITFLMALVGLWLFLQLAPRVGLIDTPNARSLHGTPTVVGAGIVVVLAVLPGWVLVPVPSLASPAWIAAIALVLGGVGLADDRYSLPSAPRLLVYGLACATAVQGEFDADAGAALGLTLGLLWLVNLFNFMDGADGFAGLQALAVCSGMGLLSGLGPAPAVAPLWWLLCGALLPFMVFNWPPARCFMGDAGAVPLGFLLGVAGLASFKAAPILGAAWLILMMPFLADATVTLLRRLAAGHAPHHPHRDHAYQRAVRRFGSPLPVDLGLAGLHLVWQFPVAVAAVQLPDLAPILVILSAIPTLLLLVYLRSAA